MLTRDPEIGDEIEITDHHDPEAPLVRWRSLGPVTAIEGNVLYTAGTGDRFGGAQVCWRSKVHHDRYTYNRYLRIKGA